MTTEMLPYPVPALVDGINAQGVCNHFAGLHKDPPPQLRSTWYVVVLRRMAGQDVDAECAELLHLERTYHAGKSLTEVETDAPVEETPAQKAFRTFRESQRGK